VTFRRLVLAQLFAAVCSVNFCLFSLSNVSALSPIFDQACSCDSSLCSFTPVVFRPSSLDVAVAAQLAAQFHFPGPNNKLKDVLSSEYPQLVRHFQCERASLTFCCLLLLPFRAFHSSFRALAGFS
jgi:hypothetical protein